MGATVVDPSNNKVGTVGQVYVDPDNGQPNWMSVKTGLFGTSESFVPLEQATWDDEKVHVRYEKDFIKDAPRIDTDGALSEADEHELYRYYGTGTGGSGADTATTGSSDTDRGSVGQEASGPPADTAMTRSEEQLHVSTEKRPTGRARLRKHVVTENETVTVPVTREEVRLEREPISDGNVGPAMDGPAISEQEHEVILNEERVVVDKEAVPVERIRLDKDTVTEQEQVSEEVRKERIDLDDDGTTRPGAGL
jgi:uncharacterized protein (TIGR02271 family)